ncbi:unnamed protein product, partial [Linum tenue]
MNNQGAAHPRLVTPPSIKLSPHSSYHRLPVPPSFSLFYWLFSRVPDTLVLMLITIAFFIIHLTTFYYTKFFKKRGSPWWLFLAVAVFGFIVIFFYCAYWIRKKNWCRRKYGTFGKLVGLAAVVACSASYIWLGESDLSYLIFILTLIGMFTACILAIRPSTDFNLVNGLLISLLTYIIRVLHHGTIAGYCVGLSPSAPAAAPSPSMAVAPSCVDPRLGPSSPYPWLLMVGCFSIAGLRFYLESRGLNADEEGL